METSTSVAEATTSAVVCGEPCPVMAMAATIPSRPTKKASPPVHHGALHHGALLGAGLTLGLTMASRFIAGILKKRRQATKLSPSTASTPRTPRASMTATPEVYLTAFGSPTPMCDPDVTSSPRFKPTLRTAPPPQDKAPESVEPEGQPGAKGRALPPGQLQKALQEAQEAQEENARLRTFMKEYMATSDKVKVLEQENTDLKNVMSRLETQLNDIKAKTVISNGAELSSFKDAVKDRFPAIARSVCSDIDFGIKDNGSVDGTSSVIDIGTRKKMGTLSQLFAWANQAQPPLPPKPAGPSQPLTPRRTRSTQDSVQSSDVVQLLNAFSAGGMQF